MLRADERSSRAFASLHRAPALAQNGLLRPWPRNDRTDWLPPAPARAPLGIALEPGMRDELTGVADRSEPLVVEIIRQSVGLERLDQFERTAQPPSPERSRRTRSNRLPRKSAGR